MSTAAVTIMPHQGDRPTGYIGTSVEDGSRFVLLRLGTPSSGHDLMLSGYWSDDEKAEWLAALAGECAALSASLMLAGDAA